MPLWEQGIQDGEKVRVKYTMPVNFKLQQQKGCFKMRHPKSLQKLSGCLVEIRIVSFIVSGVNSYRSVSERYRKFSSGCPEFL